MSCATAPKEAKVTLPAQLAEWATLSCTRFGHVIRSKSDWVWHSPRNDEFVRIWAQGSDGEMEASGHADHFSKIEFQELSAQEAREANNALASSLGAKPQPVADAFELLVTSAKGQRQIVIFVRTEANLRLGNMWGWACSDPCQEPTVFMGFKP